MNRKNKILVGCLALLLVLSVGYALFSEQVTINGTAKAKGDFSISVLEADLTDDGIGSMTPYGADPGDGENPTMSINGNVVTTNVEFSRPGQVHVLGIELKNTGSIPARLKSIKDVTRNVVILDKDNYNADYIYYGVGADKNKVTAVLSTETGYEDDYQYSKDDYMRYNDYLTNTDGMLDAVLDPGESVYFFFEYCWDHDSTESGETLNLSWSLQFNFEQVTTN